MKDLDLHINNLEVLIGALRELKALDRTVAKPLGDTLLNLIASPDWPQVVDQEDIVNEVDDEEKTNRAITLLETIIPHPLHNHTFLDFGCGEGHVAKIASETAKLSVGYDIVQPKIKSQDGLLLTTNWEQVMAAGPYDVILCYDVIDHVEQESQLNAMQKIASVLKPSGKVYMRCHPWCSRHATHLYRQKNKAFLHLVFSTDELKLCGLKGLPTIKTIHPQLYYPAEVIAPAGLHYVQKQLHTDPVEPFFESNSVTAQRIRAHWADSEDQHIRNGGFPSYQMSLSWIDYTLSKN